MHMKKAADLEFQDNGRVVLLEPPKGIEPLTFSLRVRCSAD
jgi:hypothetical protein